jgi:hypothetical protein
MSLFDRFTRAFAFASFHHAIGSLFGGEVVPGCGHQSCQAGGPSNCPDGCRCGAHGLCHK